MAVTPFKFPPLFRKPKSVEIPKRLEVRAVVVDSSDTAGYSKSRFKLNVRKMQLIKQYSRFSRFLLLRQGFWCVSLASPGVNQL